MAMAKVFTIPAGEPFVDRLAAGILAGAAAPEALPRMTVLLPTRRACRALREAFLRAGDGRPLLLPRLSPIGDIDDDELVLAAAASGGAPPADADLPPPIPALRRTLLLARLVARQRGASLAPDQAVWLAGELARLLDEVETERLAFARLAEIVPEEFAGHWQQTLKFLEIVTANWPSILAEEGALDPAAHRNAALAAQAAAWRRAPPPHPVIAAGSTGSIPATADLLAVIAGLPQGSVVLPGLDRALDDAAWEAVRAAPSHPQHGLARLLHRLEIERGAVHDWPSGAPGLAAPSGPAPATPRARFLSAAMRPATVDPPEAAAAPEIAALAGELRDGVIYLECQHPRDEAGVIALILRERLEEAGQTAALVTADRDLARRVAVALGRWGIAIDDSAGTPLAATAPATFLRLVAAAAAEAMAPVALLAALKHPLAAAGRERGEFLRATRRLEIAALRGPRPAPGIAGLSAALGAASSDRATSLALIAALETCFAPLAAAMASDAVGLAALLHAHVAAAEALAASAGEAGAARLWSGDAGEALARFVAELAEAARDFGPIEPARYPALLDALLAGRAVRPRFGTHPRLAILGPLEARLQQFDLVVLGGLNEGTWPAAVAADPWMSRPMRERFGLPLAERRIGLAAHDFAQGFMAPRVVLTRAMRAAGKPTRPSRWLLRIEAELARRGLLMSGDEGIRQAWRATKFQTWLRQLDDAPLRPVGRPAPRPPLAARPTGLSVTRIETWRRDPYAIYAREILRLEPLPPLDEDPSVADLGIVIHEALAAFLKPIGGGALPPDALPRLLACGRAAFAPWLSRPGLAAFWWPRFERLARWFVAAEAARRAQGIAPLAHEVAGRIALDGFTLRGRADRIDRGADGGLIVIDYKSGARRNQSDVAAGLASQLPLEGLMIERGGFEAVAGSVAAFEYWYVTGHGEGGKIERIDAGAGRLTAEAEAGLRNLVREFAKAETPYPALPRLSASPADRDYDHLSRVGEWAAGWRRR
jgi:ATP-dependent helicase/nuclease subunit B